MMSENILDKKFNQFTVQKYSHTDQNRKSYFFCVCTCGNSKVVSRNNLVSGGVKSCGCTTLKMIRESKLGERNFMWKGNSVGMSALHEWIKTRFPKPKRCQECKKVPPYDLANKSGKYKRELSDWEWLCRRCHMTKDGRLENFKQRKHATTV